MKNNFEDRFTKLRIRMMAWADKNKFRQTLDQNEDYIIPNHPGRDKSFKEDLTLVCKFENHKELTRLQKLFLNKLWRTYGV